ncbi:MAG: hypothetical protein QG572_641, partial [Pseudomonadota bacterium]|nr:hypothetical protein [Pseudomonadota bacterium]
VSAGRAPGADLARLGTGSPARRHHPEAGADPAADPAGQPAWRASDHRCGSASAWAAGTKRHCRHQLDQHPAYHPVGRPRSHPAAGDAAAARTGSWQPVCRARQEPASCPQVGALRIETHPPVRRCECCFPTHGGTDENAVFDTRLARRGAHSRGAPSVTKKDPRAAGLFIWNQWLFCLRDLAQ